MPTFGFLPIFFFDFSEFLKSKKDFGDVRTSRQNFEKFSVRKGHSNLSGLFNHSEYKTNHYFFKKYDNISISNSKIDIYFNEENFDENEKYNVIGNYSGVMLIENKVNGHIYLGDNYSEDLLNNDAYDFKNIYEIVAEYYIKEINVKNEYEKYN